MASRADISVPAALATASLVYAVYGRGTPPLADMRVLPPGQPDIEATRKQNAWMAAGAVAGISLIAGDPMIFIVGGAMVIGLDWLSRHASWTDPTWGKVKGALDFADQAVPTQAVDDGAYGPLAA